VCKTYFVIHHSLSRQPCGKESTVTCIGTETHSSDCWLVLFQSSPVVTTRSYYAFKITVTITHKVFNSLLLCIRLLTLVPLLICSERLVFTWKLPTTNCLGTVKVTMRLTVSQSVLASSSYLGLVTRYLLLFDSYSLVIVGHPLRREDGSVFCQSYCLL
jgi:hypothetical protein